MKKNLLMILVLISTLAVQAQDSILMLNDKKIEAKVTEIGTTHK